MSEYAVHAIYAIYTVCVCVCMCMCVCRCMLICEHTCQSQVLTSAKAYVHMCMRVCACVAYVRVCISAYVSLDLLVFLFSKCTLCVSAVGVHTTGLSDSVRTAEVCVYLSVCVRACMHACVHACVRACIRGVSHRSRCAEFRITRLSLPPFPLSRPPSLTPLSSSL